MGHLEQVFTGSFCHPAISVRVLKGTESNHSGHRKSSREQLFFVDSAADCWCCTICVALQHCCPLFKCSSHFMYGNG